MLSFLLSKTSYSSCRLTPKQCLLYMLCFYRSNLLVHLKYFALYNIHCLFPPVSNSINILYQLQSERILKSNLWVWRKQTCLTSVISTTLNRYTLGETWFNVLQSYQWSELQLGWPKSMFLDLDSLKAVLQGVRFVDYITMTVGTTSPVNQNSLANPHWPM